MWEMPTEHRAWFGRKAPEEWPMQGVQGCKYREAAVGRGCVFLLCQFRRREGVSKAVRWGEG